MPPSFCAKRGSGFAPMLSSKYQIEKLGTKGKGLPIGLRRINSKKESRSSLLINRQLVLSIEHSTSAQAPITKTIIWSSLRSRLTNIRKVELIEPGVL